MRSKARFLVVLAVAMTMAALFTFAFLQRRAALRSFDDQVRMLSEMTLGTIELAVYAGQVDRIRKTLEAIEAYSILAGVVLYDERMNRLVVRPEGFVPPPELESTGEDTASERGRMRFHKRPLRSPEGGEIGYLLMAFTSAPAESEIRRRLVLTLAVGLLLLAPALSALAWQIGRSEQALRRSHDELEARVEHRTRQLRELAHHLQSVREEERKGVAREIHDELGQQLTALNMDLTWLDRHLADNPASLKERIKDMFAVVRELIQTGSRISAQLRPKMLDDLGLVSTLGWQLDEFKERTGIRCDLAVSPGEMTAGTAVATALFRITQEALTNVARHAQATRVDLRLAAVDRRLRLEIRDNGKGFDQETASHRGSFGLLGMSERALALGGELWVESAAGSGTRIIVEIPMGNS